MHGMRALEELTPTTMARPPDFSFRTRAKNLERLADDQFDVLVIGGGITGAGVARDAALRGLPGGLTASQAATYYRH